MAKRCDECGTVYMDIERHSCEEERAWREKKRESSPGMKKGSLGLGIVLGLFLGLLGWIIAYLVKETDTKQGAVYGIAIRIAALIIWVTVSIAFDLGPSP